uniref:Uncharacterized protein n=1 Tax=Fusarium oxysporum (strain Fo5176) TaxID=660025 RepID=A0A0C4BKU7_FUSOF
MTTGNPEIRPRPEPSLRTKDGCLTSYPPQDQDDNVAVTLTEPQTRIGTCSALHVKGEGELILHGYFFTEFLPLITLTWMQDTPSRSCPEALRKSMLEHEDLKYSILACSAAHLHQSSNTQSLPAALEFYHRAVKEVQKSVLSPDQDSTLSHLGAVVHMLKRRINYNAPNNLDDRPTTLLDLHALDSTLFHIFRVAVWHPNANRGFLVDTEFWSMAERLLKHANDAGTYSSLVLGFPTSFYKMILCMVQYAREPGCQSEKTLAGLETELNFYKAACENEPTNGSPFNTNLDFYSAQPSVAYAYRLFDPKLIRFHCCVQVQ